MAALCVTLDLTVAVSCTRTDDVVQSVVARSIIRPPVGGKNPRTPAAVDEPTQTCTHTFTHERESATRRTAANLRHSNRSVKLDARPRIRAHINQSATRRTAANPN